MARKQRRSGKGYSVARTTYSGPRGGSRETSTYYARFKDHAGSWHRVPAFSDYDASMELARKMRRLAELRAVGELPSEELAVWLDGIADELRDRLIAWNMLDQRRSMISWPIGKHVDEWIRSVLADGNTTVHTDLIRARVDRILKGCHVAKFSDIDELAVQTWLAGQDMKIQTRNHYVRAIKQFCRWMTDHGRATSSPVAGLKMLRVTDKRERRALTLDQLKHLIVTTHNGPLRGKTTGAGRATLYWTAAETGLRAAELRSLTVSSFDLKAVPPTVTVAAAYAKNRRRDTLALTAELAARLREHFQGKLPTAPSFRIPTLTAKMLRSDLERARIPYVDEAGGYFDFHSLRVQCASNLCRGGAHPAVAQARMRHSTITLTMDLYTQLGSDKQSAALDALPKLSVG